MTGPTPAARRDWWARPRVVLPIVAAFVVLLALLTPQPSFGRIGDPRLSAHLAGSLGARLLAETAGRFGYGVVREDTLSAPTATAARGRTIHAVLAPVIPMDGAQAHAYLQAVRGGDALLLVFDDRNALSDSLGVWRTAGGTLYRAPEDSSDCRRLDLTPALWPDGRVHLYGLRWTRGAPRDLVVLAALQDQRAGTRGEDAAAGFALGRGRVVVIPDPDLLRNDVLRRCEWGADVLAMRMLEWLRAGGDVPRDSLVFDEYHQGFGRSPSSMGTASRFLVAHPVGRGILVLACAGLVLLAALGPRPIPPREEARVERRDPLEQVDALAHAYEQVNATRTVVRQLLRGVRARAERGSPATRLRTDEEFLSAAAAADRTLDADASLIARTLREPVAVGHLPDVGAALGRLDASLSTTRA